MYFTVVGGKKYKIIKNKNASPKLTYDQKPETFFLGLAWFLKSWTHSCRAINQNTSLSMDTDSLSRGRFHYKYAKSMDKQANNVLYK